MKWTYYNRLWFEKKKFVRLYNDFSTHQSIKNQLELVKKVRLWSTRKQNESLLEAHCYPIVINRYDRISRQEVEYEKSSPNDRRWRDAKVTFLAFKWPVCFWKGKGAMKIERAPQITEFHSRAELMDYCSGKSTPSTLKIRTAAITTKVQLRAPRAITPLLAAAASLLLHSLFYPLP